MRCAWLTRASGLVGAAALSLVDCYAATAVRVELGTDVDCNGATTALFVNEASAPSADTNAAAPTAVATGCPSPAPNNIGTVVLVPRGAKDASMRIEVVLARGGRDPATCRSEPKECVVARRIVAYKKHDTRALPIFLSNQCLGVECAENETCVAGNCVGADVDSPGFCAGDGCDAGATPPPQPPPGVDAGREGGAEEPPLPRPCLNATGILASGVPRPTGPMRANASHVFWPSAVGLVVMPRGGGGLTLLQGFTHVALLDAYAVVASANGFAYAQPDGNNPGLTRSLPGLTAIAGSGPRALASAGGDLYELDAAAVPALVHTLAADRMALDAQYIYTTTGKTSKVLEAKIPFTQLGAFIVPSPPVDVVAFGGRGAFLLESSILIAEPTFSTAFQAPAGTVTLQGVAMDATNIYFTMREANRASVRYLAGANATPVALVDNQRDVTAIASDGKCVFFWRAASPAAPVGELAAVTVP